MIEQIFNYLPKLLEKLPISSNILFVGIIFSFVFFTLLFLYFDKTFEYVKDCIRKWDEVTFKRLSCFMVIPMLSLILININLIPNENLNNWVHLVISFLIVPIFPYLFLLIFRICYLTFKLGYKSLKKKKSLKIKENSNLKTID